MTLLLDAGAFIAYERGSRTVQAFLERASRTGDAVRTSTAVVAQVWQDGSRQARTALLLRGVDEAELTKTQARRIGRLLELAHTSDVVDGAIVELAKDGDEILTSDTEDIRRLAVAAGRTVIVTDVS
jgi:fructosamine-3-kinase